jgi:hypothetical protein
MGGKRIVTALVAALALGAMGSGGVLPAEASAKKAKADKDDPSRRVCRSIVPTGSRLPTRVCRTQAQWDESRQKSQDGLLDTQMGPGTTYQQDPRP